MLTDFHNSFTTRLRSDCYRIDHYESHLASNASLHYLVKCKFKETTDNLKQMARITINFNLIYYS